MAEEEQDITPEETEFEAAFAEHADAREGAPQVEDGEAVLPEDQEVAAVAEPEADPLEGLSDAQRAKFDELSQKNEQLNHQISSDTGRVSALQRKVNGLQSEIQGIREGATSGPSNQDIAAAMRGSDEEWDQFTEDYPEVARAIDNRLAHVGEASQEAFNKSVEPIQTMTAEVAASKEANENAARVNVVAETYPTWTEEVKKPEFNEWLYAQPPGIQSLAESNETDDASALIGLYDAHLVAQGQPSMQVGQAPNPDPEPGVDTTRDPGGSQPSSLDAKRRQQLEDGTTIPSKPAGIDASGQPKDEYEAAFDHFARKREARRATA